MGPFRSVYIQPAIVVLLLLLAILLAVFVLATHPLAFMAVVVVFLIREAHRRWRVRLEDAMPTEWAYAAQMTYAIPESPHFRNVAEHRQAVRQIYGMRYGSSNEIARIARLPLPFVEAVLSHIDDRGEGGAGVGARLNPRKPGPLTTAE